MSKNPRVRIVDGHRAAELLGRVLDEYCEETQERMIKAASKAGKMAKRDVQNASPDGPDGYAKGWAIRTKREKYGVTVLIYNKTHPSLTHLLEKSHLIANKKGTYGRTSPGHGQVIHIQPARDKAEEYFVDILTEEL